MMTCATRNTGEAGICTFSLSKEGCLPWRAGRGVPHKRQMVVVVVYENINQVEEWVVGRVKVVPTIAADPN